MLSSKTYKTISISGKDYKVGESLDESSLNDLTKYISSSKTLFVKEFDDQSSVNLPISCPIKIVKDAKPISVQPNKLTRKQNEMLCNKVSELLKLGIIQHSSSGILFCSYLLLSSFKFNHISFNLWSLF